MGATEDSFADLIRILSREEAQDVVLMLAERMDAWERLNVVRYVHWRRVQSGL